MSVTVVLPGALREVAQGRGRLDLERAGATVREVFRTLARQAPGVYERVMTETGDVRVHINVFVGTQNIRFADGLETPVKENDEVIILPAVSGG